jgi:hypothetical protein
MITIIKGNINVKALSLGKSKESEKKEVIYIFYMLAS